MVAAGYNQLRIRYGIGEERKRLDHEFEPLIGSPLAERENAVLRIAAAGKVRIFGSSG